MTDRPNRRCFLSTVAAAPAAFTRRDGHALPKKTVAIQIGAVSFVDEGVEAVLDTVQQRARVNSLFLITFAYNRGLAGRQVPGHPFPDHGRQEPDTNFRGGYYATPNWKYYQGVAYRDFRAPELGDFDILAAVIPSARRRGLRVYAFLADNLPEHPSPSADIFKQKSLDGQLLNSVCFNNPDYLAFVSALIEDCSNSYELDGILWRTEALGPISRVLGFTHNSPSPAACFCEHCEARARKRGISVERARRGYAELERYARASREGWRDRDGQFTAFLRLLFRYPELAAWNGMWVESLDDVYRRIRTLVKRVKPEILVGWAIAHNNCFNPFYRAENDLALLSQFTDFFKIVTYHNSGGERTARYVRNITGSLWGDLTAEQALDLTYALSGHRQGKLADIPKTGFMTDFVARETARAVAAVKGTGARIWSGIDVDIPTAPGHSRCTPEGTKQAVLAAFQAGADGVILARKYSEMHLKNLNGAGEAVKELGLSA